METGTTPVSFFVVAFSSFSRGNAARGIFAAVSLESEPNKIW
jgi:hypothetical protein